MEQNNEQVRQLREKILAKRQQIEFEENELEFEEMESPENRENPDTLEETKNFNDGPETVADPQLLRSLSKSRQDLDELLKQLSELTEK
ncbi:hypothetical protein [Dyadobacter sandarakinus]|uniref:Uncharacterized protein n=1 Tax=Dyadobacter sandarakinus TaxID=2747268 RepID=A0ABX7I2C5_9BACT|nr:hypothetical protein [Dyadobacter sandarakinus]QRQ99934.1 hypothetical protein HWI92_02890 [Dyadobacter sandarakinus]